MAFQFEQSKLQSFANQSCLFLAYANLVLDYLKKIGVYPVGADEFDLYLDLTECITIALNLDIVGSDGYVFDGAKLVKLFCEEFQKGDFEYTVHCHKSLNACYGLYTIGNTGKHFEYLGDHSKGDKKFVDYRTVDITYEPRTIF